MTDGPAVPARAAAAVPTVYLHVGTSNAETSLLQRVLQRNAHLLEEDGVRFPLDHDRGGMQVRAARDILGIRGRPTDGAWRAMVDAIQTWPGRAAVVSMEFLSLASPVRVQMIAAGLAPSPVEVIVTARDLGRVVPSAWQAVVKQGDPWSFDEFVGSVTGDGDVLPEVHRRFWRHHDVTAIAAKWVDVVGANRVHVVTVPPASAPPGLLWERFSTVLGVPPERYDLGADREGSESLSSADAELMRQVSAELRDELDRATFKRWATDYFANRVLRPPADEPPPEDRPHLSPAVQRWAAHRSEELVTGLRTLGVRVVGDLAELVPDASAGVEAPASTGVPTYPEATAHIVAALLRRIAAVDPESSRLAADDDFQDPDDAADADEAAEAAAAAAADSSREALRVRAG